MVYELQCRTDGISVYAPLQWKSIIVESAENISRYYSKIIDVKLEKEKRIYRNLNNGIIVL